MTAKGLIQVCWELLKTLIQAGLLLVAATVRSSSKDDATLEYSFLLIVYLPWVLAAITILAFDIRALLTDKQNAHRRWFNWLRIVLAAGGLPYAAFRILVVWAR
jgi:hypothetical protein